MSDEVQAIFKEIEQASTRADEQLTTINADLQKKVDGSHLTDGELFTPENAAKIRAGYEAGAEARRVEVKATLRAELAEIRERGRVALDEATKALDARRHELEKEAGPHNADEWTEAKARTEFMRADLLALDPSEIPQRYQAAQAAGDRVGAWLIAREGEGILRDRMHSLGSADVAGLGKLQIALDELNNLAWGGMRAKLEAEAAELRDLRHKMTQPFTEAERREWHADIAERITGSPPHIVAGIRNGSIPLPE